MQVIAFVGPSGTGKSHRSMKVAAENGVDAVIDDGLLLSRTKVLAGTSAKREDTRIASVKHALFLKDEQSSEVIDAIKRNNIQKLMILGTSDAMVTKIAARLELPPISQIIRIEDVATESEMRQARNIRQNQGKHVIPVPTFEIKKDFSGYFMHPLKFLKNTPEKTVEVDERTIVRPTFSYLGDYEISDNVLIAITKYEMKKLPQIAKVNDVYIRKTIHGAHIDTEITVKYGCDIREVCETVRKTAAAAIENYTSVNVRRMHILVKNVVK